MSAGWSRGVSGGIPRGFSPETAAAVGARDYWVFGDYRCNMGWCLALVRSTDAGAEFTRVAAPPLKSQGTTPTLVFANARDGYAYTWTASPLYVTHDGGESWQRASEGSAIAAAVGGRYVYTVTGRCPPGRGCHSFRLRRSPVTRTDWRSLPSPVRGGLPFSLAARGGHIWLLGETNSATHDHDRLARSTDGGRAFSVQTGPCFADLGGRLVPAGRGVVWAVCPSGMMAAVFLSRDGGRSFPATRSFHDPGGLSLPAGTNAAQVVAPSARVAFLYRGVQGPLLRTSDAGVRWTRLGRTARWGQVIWLGFSSNRDGAALAAPTQSGSTRAAFWRTTDGGATWHVVPLS